MRNLKKVLSLSLALVMLLGMMVVGAGAAEYTDAGEIEYKEAADVLTAIGVMQGRDNGSFDPKAELDRAEGAAIIYRMLTGGMTQNPSAASTGFVDVDGVANYAWASGIIADLANKGIVAGEDATHFNPSGKLNGYAFGKMLLVALGYNAQSQGYVGGGWEGNVIRDAYNRNISVTGVIMSNNITREQAAQMSLNTLQATMVYQKGGIQVGDVVIPGDKAEDITVTAAPGKDYRVGNNTDTGMQFCETYFPNLKLDTADDDDFGRPGGNKWVYNKETAFSGTKSASYSIVVDAANKNLAHWAGKANKNMTVKGDATITGNGYTSGNLNIGDEVEFYDVTDNVAATVVIVRYSVGTVSAVTTNKDGDVRYSVSGLYGAGNANGTDYADDTADTVVVEGTVEKGDTVTWTKADDGDTLYIYPTTTFDGVQESYRTSSGKNTITVDGQTYTVSGAITSSFNADFPNSADAATFYVDKNGFVVKSEAVEASADYAILDGIIYQAASGTRGKPYALANLILADGTVLNDVKVTRINGLNLENGWNGTTSKGFTSHTDVRIQYANSSAASPEIIKLSTNVAQNSDLDGVIVSYSESNGNYSLTLQNLTKGTTDADIVVTLKGERAGTGAAAETATTKGNPSVTYADSQTVTATSKTTYVVKSGTSGKITVYTGFRNVPTIKTGTAADSKLFVTVLRNASNQAELVYIDATSSAATVGDEAGDILYLISATPSIRGTARDEYYSAIVNGEETTVKTKAGANLFDSDDVTKLFVLTYDADGFVTAAAPVSPSATWPVAGSSLGSVANAEDQTIGSYTYDNPTVIAIEDGALIEGATVEDADVSDNLWIKVKGNDGVDAITIDTIYIVKDGAANLPSDATPEAIESALSGGGTVNLPSGTTLNDVTVPKDGKLVLDGTSTIGSDGVTVEAGGTLEIKGDVTSTGTVKLDGGTIEVSENAKLPNLANGSTGTVKTGDGKTVSVGSAWSDIGDSKYASTATTPVEGSGANAGKYTATVARSKVEFSGEGTLNGWNGSDLSDGRHVYKLDLTGETADQGAFETGVNNCYYTVKGSDTKHELALGGAQLADDTEMILLLPTDVDTIVLTYDNNNDDVTIHTYTFKVTD